MLGNVTFPYLHHRGDLYSCIFSDKYMGGFWSTRDLDRWLHVCIRLASGLLSVQPIWAPLGAMFCSCHSNYPQPIVLGLCILQIYDEFEIGSLLLSGMTFPRNFVCICPSPFAAMRDKIQLVVDPRCYKYVPIGRWPPVDSDPVGSPYIVSLIIVCKINYRLLSILLDTLKRVYPVAST